ncbi:MAG: epoxyqueuosine reductase QueH, partial [Bacteroidales bacterium]|nr:epoxyqueuosine reductase QueH [Bacteroidales bacterium]
MVEEWLRPGVFFSNSNIVPYEEYVKRREELGRYAASFGLEVIDDDYDHAAWTEYVRSRAGAALAGPERGPRCLACFEFRLLRAAHYAASHGYDILTTTLASSRWKDLSQVDAAGRVAVERYSPPMNASLRSAPPLASQSEAPVPPLIVPRVAEFPGGEYLPTETLRQLVWWNQNWRKGGMQERRIFLIKSCALYNQTWCGCEFSSHE